MRRPVAVVAALAAALLVLAAPPASAGGPTSVLAVNYDGSRSAGALTGSLAYAALEKALDVYETPSGDALAPASFMGSRVRLTWLIHDVIPWRVDAISIDGSSVWVETAMNPADGKSLFEAPTVRYRPKDADLLVETLTSLGVFGAVTPAGTPDSVPAPSSAAAEPLTNGFAAAAGGPTAPADATGWRTTGRAFLALALGVGLGVGVGFVLARRLPLRRFGPSPSPRG